MRIFRLYTLYIALPALLFLLSLNLSTTERAALLGLARQTLYRFEQNILARMNEKYEAGKLQRLLTEKIEEAMNE